MTFSTLPQAEPISYIEKWRLDGVQIENRSYADKLKCAFYSLNPMVVVNSRQ